MGRPKKTDPAALAELLAALPAEHAQAVVEHREAKRAPLTAFAAKLLAREFAKCQDPVAAAECMIRSGWQGFEASWMERRQFGNQAAPRGFDALEADLKRRIEQQVGRPKDDGPDLPLLRLM